MALKLLTRKHLGTESEFGVMSNQPNRHYEEPSMIKRRNVVDFLRKNKTWLTVALLTISGVSGVYGYVMCSIVTNVAAGYVGTL